MNSFVIKNIVLKSEKSLNINKSEIFRIYFNLRLENKYMYLPFQKITTILRFILNKKRKELKTVTTTTIYCIVLILEN